MIIKKIEINNFLCYYGTDNIFEFADGLNIILGENGEGKTKFFEAIVWLFEGGSNFKSKVSAKALKEAERGSEFEVSVVMEVEQYDVIKTVKRSFVVEKEDDADDFLPSSPQIIGIIESKNGEREKVDGEKLLDTIFPPEIRKYSLFKGESELNIFDNRDALNHLVNSFSSAKHYEKYVSIGSYLKKKSEAAVDKEIKNNSNKKNEIELLKVGIKSLEKEVKNYKEQIEINEAQKIKTEKEIKDAEKFVENADNLKIINDRIEKFNHDIIREEGRIKENYTTFLFDESWILSNYESIHQEFSDKINKLQKDRRRLQKNFDIEEGKRRGKEELTEEFLNGSLPLPIGVPSKIHMEEMIKEKICKVCNRPAKEGSSAYKFMEKRLKEYLAKQKPKVEKKQIDRILFENNYTQKLLNLSTSHENSLSSLRNIEAEIKDRFQFNTERKEKIKLLKEELENEIEDREKVIGKSSVGEKKLISIVKNYTGWQRDITRIIKKISELEQEKKSADQKLREKIDQKEAIDMESASSFLTATRKILRDVEIIFRETQEAKYDEFIQKLEKKSNSIFQEINIDDFTGTIKLQKKILMGQPQLNIELHERDGIYYNPNQSLVTSMHMAILFAISELASELKNESYPMLFDAPTSSFGETKTKEFLNLIYETKKQRIILFKNYVGKDKNGNQTVKNEFKNVKRHKAFWIKRHRPFDKVDLSTINTNVISNI